MIIPGAEPIELAGASDRGVLMLHGFGDTPQTLDLLARRVNAAGFYVRAPLYPGHGRTPEEFFKSRAGEWVECARHSLAGLRRQCSSISVVGLSIGAAIAALLAAEFAEMRAMVMLAPYLGMPWSVRVAAFTHRLWEPFVGSVSAQLPGSIRDPSEREKNLGYGVVSGRSLRELATIVDRGRRALKNVRCPALVIQSREDPRLRPRIAEVVMQELGSGTKKLIWLRGCGHIITVDYCREKVFEECLAWLSSWADRPSG